MYLAMFINNCVRAVPENTISFGDRFKFVLKISVVVSSKLK